MAVAVPLTEAHGTANRVLVYARVRPTSHRQSTCVETLEETNVVHVREGSAAQEFNFDGVFPPDVAQEQVFSRVGFPVVSECLKGFNGSILAYGQTGSGKTHSLLHQGESPRESGLLPRVVSQIFDHIAQDSTSVYEVEAAAMQVYNEQVDDLLNSHHKSGKGHNLFVQNSGDVPDLTWTHCRHAEELSRTFSRARTNLVYAETKMNKASSRSHAIFQIKITKHGESEATFSRLSIVDLAGSERVKKSGVDGMQFKEATAINKSLLAFGNVVSALVAKKRHVPFRDSKLTHVLSPCIGSNCKTSLLVCASPAEEHVPETLCSLEFASRAMQIEVHARMNRMVPLSGGAVAGACVTMHQVDDAVKCGPEDELANTKQTLAETVRSLEEARMQMAETNEARLQAVERAEKAEARALLAEQDLRGWRERYGAATQEIESIKVANTIAESRAQSAEEVANDWKFKCTEATQRIDSLETMLLKATQDSQLRRTQLCATTAELEKAQLQHVESDLYKQEVAEASQAAQLAAARAVQCEATSQKTVAAAKAEAAAAKAEKARALREAQALAFEREQSKASFECSKAAWREACVGEEQRLARLEKSLQDQQENVMQRAGLVEGLETEKEEVARKRKQLEDERQQLQLEKRRIRNGILGSGPPPLQLKSSSEKPVSLAKMLTNDRVEQTKSRSTRSSSESQLRKSPSLARSGSLVFREETQPNSYAIGASSRSSSRPRVRGNA